MTRAATRTATGVVRFFSPERGYGFIQPDGSGTALYMHVSQAINRHEPRDGDRVAFIQGTGRDGRPAALHIRILA